MWSEFAAGFGGGCDWRRHKSWWGAEGFEDFWGGPRGRPHRRQGRVFEQGDLKLVILRLLAEKPRHGYDVIKELEARFGGRYAPSPGTVYPTLTMLEDMGFARVVPEEGGKKIYEITDAGRAHLEENATGVNDIFDRIARFVEGFTDAPMREMNIAFRHLAGATFSTASRRVNDKEALDQIRAILERAAAEIEALRPTAK